MKKMILLIAFLTIAATSANAKELKPGEYQCPGTEDNRGQATTTTNGATQTVDPTVEGNKSE